MSTKKKNLHGVPLMIAGMLMIVAAFGLVMYNNWESDRAGEASEMALPALESLIFDKQMDQSGDEFTWTEE